MSARRVAATQWCDNVSNMNTTANLGSEHDLDITKALLQVLREMGAQEVSRDWGVAGSQDVKTLQYSLNGRPLTVEAETYVGLSVQGDCQTVEAIKSRVCEIVQP